MACLTATYFTIGRVWCETAAVARRRAVNPFLLPEQAFYAPETAHRENGHVHIVRNMCHRMAVDHVRGGDRHRGYAAWQSIFLLHNLGFIEMGCINTCAIGMLHHRRLRLFI